MTCPGHRSNPRNPGTCVKCGLPCEHRPRKNLVSTTERLQQEAPPGKHTTLEFFNWVMGLAERVERREVSAFDALMAVRWTVYDRMQNELDKLAQTYRGSL